MTDYERSVRLDEPLSGRRSREDGTSINEADALTGVLTGNRAYVTQPYSEMNVKRGLEYYLRVAWPLGDEIPAGGSRKILFNTGAKQVLAKLRIVDYIAEELQIDVYSDPVGVAGGTPVQVGNWNAVAPVPTTVTVTKNVTTTSDGIRLDPNTEYFFGGVNAPNRQSNSIPFGRERVLPPDTDFLVVITNNANNSDARVQYFLDWFEGETDVDNPPV